MAVQGQPKERMCPQCFEINPAGATFCQLCGAALSEGKETSEGSDTEVYRELAATNLMRMRGDYKGAIQICLGILKKFPNNATAHTLLGDVHAEMGELQQAAEWYEMALDLNPKSEADKKKLADIKRRIHEREQAMTAEQIGLNTAAKPKTGLYIGVMAGVILLVGAGAFALGAAMRGGGQAAKPPITGQIKVSDQEPAQGGTAGQPSTAGGAGQQGSTTPAEDEGSGAEGSSAPSTPAPPIASAGPDKALIEFLRTRGANSSSVVNVTEDPRSSHFIVTVEGVAGKEDKALAALVAADVFQQMSSASKATIRVVQRDQTTLVADVEKQAFDAAMQALQSGQTAADAADTILANVWPAAQ